MQKKTKKKEINLPISINVFIDPKTKAHSIALPFRLEDNTAAVVIITRLKDEMWKPEQIIKSITINYV